MGYNCPPEGTFHLGVYFPAPNGAPWECVKRDGSSPNHGIINFDTIGNTFLLIFTVVTLENWAQSMYYAIDAMGPVAVVYFIPMVVVCSFFLLNILIAVIMSRFDEINEERREMVAEEKAKMRRSRALARATNTPTYYQTFFQRGDSCIRWVFCVDTRCGRVVYGVLSRPWSRFTSWCCSVMESSSFDHFFLLAIVVNTAVLASEHEGMSLDFEWSLDICNTVLAILFTFESGFKLFGMGLQRFFEDSFNSFDVILVVTSLAELISACLLGDCIPRPEQTTIDGLPTTPTAGGAGGALRMVRTFRLLRVLRVLKLVRYVESLRRLLNVITRSLASLTWIMLLLFLFILVFAILGQQLFGGKLDEAISGKSALLYNNFDTFQEAMLTTFQLVTGDNWNYVMYEAMNGTGWIYCAYFILWVMVGNFVLLNLLLVIILNSFLEEPAKEGEVSLSDQRSETKRKGSCPGSVGVDVVSASAANGEDDELDAQIHPSLRALSSTRSMPEGKPRDVDAGDDDALDLEEAGGTSPGGTSTGGTSPSVGVLRFTASPRSCNAGSAEPPLGSLPRVLSGEDISTDAERNPGGAEGTATAESADNALAPSAVRVPLAAGGRSAATHPSPPASPPEDGAGGKKKVRRNSQVEISIASAAMERAGLPELEGGEAELRGDRPARRASVGRKMAQNNILADASSAFRKEKKAAGAMEDEAKVASFFFFFSPLHTRPHSLSSLSLSLPPSFEDDPSHRI